MDLRQAEALARRLIATHINPDVGEVKGPVHFRWDRRTSALGSYEVRIKRTIDVRTHAILEGYVRTISLSRPMTEVCDESQVLHTILHEIAHARAGIRAQHGPLWAQECNLLGIEPKVCGGRIGVEIPLPRHGVRAVCRVCGAKHWRARMPAAGRRLACGQCRSRADFAARELHWTR